MDGMDGDGGGSRTQWERKNEKIKEIQSAFVADTDRG